MSSSSTPLVIDHEFSLLDRARNFIQALNCVPTATQWTDEALEREANEDVPTIKLVFKDVTYEQTQSKDFRQRLEKSLPAPKRKQLGNWSEQFDAARESSDASPAKGKA